MELKGKIKLYQDGKSTIVVISDTEPDVKNVVSSVLQNICNAPIKEVSEIDAVTEKDTVPDFIGAEDFTPDFLTEPIVEEKEETVVEEQVEDFATHIVTMNGKYKTANKTISQIYEEDAQWLEWVADKCKSPHEDVKKIKTFLDIHKNQ